MKKPLKHLLALTFGAPIAAALPAGYSWTTDNGVQVTYLGRRVFDDGRNFYVGDY